MQKSSQTINKLQEIGNQLLALVIPPGRPAFLVQCGDRHIQVAHLDLKGFIQIFWFFCLEKTLTNG